METETITPEEVLEEETSERDEEGKAVDGEE